MYCYEVLNAGTDPLYGIFVGDDNGTPLDVMDDFAINMTGCDNLDGSPNADDLAPGNSCSGWTIKTFPFTGTIINTAEVFGTDGWGVLYTGSDTATVISQGPTTVSHYIPTTGTYIFGGEVNVTLEVTSLTTPGTVTIIVHPDEFHPGAINDSVKRWFEITSTAVGTFNITLSYQDGELAGEVESALCLWRFSVGTWDGPYFGTVDITANTITINNVSDFSDWIMRDNQLLPPVPEAATIILICVGITVLGGYVWSRRRKQLLAMV